MTLLGFLGSRDSGDAFPAAETWLTRVNDKQVEVLRLGTGQPLVFLHGWGLSPRPYLPALRALAARGYTVYAPSLPGFGRSEARAPWQQGVRGVATHMTAAIEGLGFDGPVPIVGHSFGGGVALRLASQRPDLASSLTLFSPVGGAGNGPSSVHGLIAEAAQKVDPAFIAGWLWWCAPSLLRRPVSAAVSARAARHADLVTEARAACGAGLPVHLVFADNDFVVRPGDLPTCAAGIVATTVAGRHSWILGDPQRFTDLVTASLPPIAIPA